VSEITQPSKWPDVGELLSKDEARRIAVDFAKRPDLLRRGV